MINKAKRRTGPIWVQLGSNVHGYILNLGPSVHPKQTSEHLESTPLTPCLRQNQLSTHVEMMGSDLKRNTIMSKCPAAAMG